MAPHKVASRLKGGAWTLMIDTEKMVIVSFNLSPKEFVK